MHALYVNICAILDIHPATENTDYEIPLTETKPPPTPLTRTEVSTSDTTGIISLFQHDSCPRGADYYT